MKKIRKRSKIIILAMCLSMVFGMSLVSNAAGAAKIGNYCRVVAAYVSDGSSTNIYNATGKNLTTVNKYMTVSLKAYYPNGSLYSSNSSYGNTAPNGEKSTTLSEVPTTCNVYAKTTICTGTSVSTPELETVSVKVN